MTRGTSSTILHHRLDGRWLKRTLRVDGEIDVNGPKRPPSEHQLWFSVRQIAEDLDQAKALAHEYHTLTESSEPAEIGPMGATPISQAPIAFALIVRKGGVNFIETRIRYLGGFDDTARFSTSVEHDPMLTGRRGVRLVLRAASRGLDPSDYKFKQLICELGTVSERKSPEVLIPFGTGLFMVFQVLRNDNLRRDTGG